MNLFRLHVDVDQASRDGGDLEEQDHQDRAIAGRRATPQLLLTVIDVAVTKDDANAVI